MAGCRRISAPGAGPHGIGRIPSYRANQIQMFCGSSKRSLKARRSSSEKYFRSVAALVNSLLHRGLDDPPRQICLPLWIEEGLLTPKHHLCHERLYLVLQAAHPPVVAGLAWHTDLHLKLRTLELLRIATTLDFRMKMLHPASGARFENDLPKPIPARRAPGSRRSYHRIRTHASCSSVADESASGSPTRPNTSLSGRTRHEGGLRNRIGVLILGAIVTSNVCSRLRK